MLTASQIRAARAILNWSQSDLAAKAGISLATIRKIELDDVSPRNTTIELIASALENAGIEFMEPDGARRKPSGIIIFEGKPGGRDFMEDIRQTVIKNGGDLFIVTPIAEAFAKYCGLSDILEIDALLNLNDTTIIKCLITEGGDSLLSTPRLQFRVISKNYVDPVPFCVYGSKYAVVVPNGEPFGKLVIIESPKMACLARNHFVSLWDKAMTVTSAAAPKIRAYAA